MVHTLYFHHGWGYDATFWQPLLNHLPQVTPILVDEGYLNAPATPALPEEPYWAVGHSAGVMALLGQELPGCCGIVALNGFAQFCQDDAFPCGIPPRVLDRMSRRIGTAPAAVLRSFRELCEDTDSFSSDHLNIAALKKGLDRLRHESFHSALSRWEGRLYSLTGTHDPLPPAQKGLPFPAYHEEHAGGHLLPLTHPSGCAAFIQHIMASYDS